MKLVLSELFTILGILLFSISILLGTHMYQVYFNNENTLLIAYTYLNMSIVSLDMMRICCFCCCCSHINSHNQVRGHRTGSSHSEAEEHPRETQTTRRWYTRISQLTQFMSPPDTYKKWNRESAYEVPGPYWCIRLTTRPWKSRPVYLSDWPLLTAPYSSGESTDVWLTAIDRPVQLERVLVSVGPPLTAPFISRALVSDWPLLTTLCSSSDRIDVTRNLASNCRQLVRVGGWRVLEATRQGPSLGSFRFLVFVGFELKHVKIVLKPTIFIIQDQPTHERIRLPIS